MSNLNHYFLAILLPDEVKAALAEWSKTLHDLPFNYKEWVHEKDFHITLKFLGGVADKQLVELNQKLESSKTSMSPFSIKGGPIGTFGSPKEPRILWAGVEAEETLFNNQAIVDKICSESGFAIENRPYRPHITIAKKWCGGTLNIGVIPSLPMEFFKSWTVDSFVLYQIHPSKKPKYEVVATYDFGNGQI
jgi:RNA 2',3'-cyclic 3'-phosphodiesterase